MCLLAPALMACLTALLWTMVPALTAHSFQPRWQSWPGVCGRPTRTMPRHCLLTAVPAVVCALPVPLWLWLVFPVAARVVPWLKGLLALPSQLQWAFFCPALVVSIGLLALRTCNTPGAIPVALLLRLQVLKPITAVRLYLVPALPTARLRSLVVCHPFQIWAALTSECTALQ